MDGNASAGDLITITQAANLAPGRPTTSCIWRWCRKGVLARDGQRIRLEHRRVGGKIFTTLAWMEAFGRALAEADARYFDLCEATAEAASAQTPRLPHHRSNRFQEQRRRQIEQAERELQEAGL